MSDEERKQMNLSVAIIGFIIVMIYGAFQSCV